MRRLVCLGLAIALLATGAEARSHSFGHGVGGLRPHRSRPVSGVSGARGGRRRSHEASGAETFRPVERYKGYNLYTHRREAIGQ